MVTDTIVLQPHGVSISTSRPFLRRTRSKLKLHAAEAGGIQKGVRGWLRFKLNLHTAEARWYPVSFHTLSSIGGIHDVGRLFYLLFSSLLEDSD